MILYTGNVSMIVLIASVLSALLLNKLPTIAAESSSTSIAVARWTLLLVFTLAIYVAGLFSNRTKVVRSGFNGKPVEGSPNTIFFIPLQYCALIYLALFAVAIVTWTNKEALAQ